MSLIKKIVTNNFAYDGLREDFTQDTYTRIYKIKIYFCGLLIINRSLNENVKRPLVESGNKKIGF